MEMWSPYTSNYNNPISNKDFLGNEPEECCGWFDPFIEGGKKLLISASGVVNGSLNSVTGGRFPTDPFKLRDRLNDDERELYDNSGTVGQIGTFAVGSFFSLLQGQRVLLPFTGSN